MKVYDVFGLIPPPSEQDGPDVQRRYAEIAAGRPGHRRRHLLRLPRRPLGGDGIVRATWRAGRRAHHRARPGAVRGHHHLDEPVAFAHLDGDWYESTMTCLTRIAPLVVAGQADRARRLHTWSGCRRTVDEYFQASDFVRARRECRRCASKRARTPFESGPLSGKTPPAQASAASPGLTSPRISPDAPVPVGTGADPARHELQSLRRRSKNAISNAVRSGALADRGR